MSIWCWLKTVWHSVWDGAPISGHNYKIEAVVHNATVETLCCEDCGQYSVAWSVDE